MLVSGDPMALNSVLGSSGPRSVLSLQATGLELGKAGHSMAVAMEDGAA